MFQKNGVTNTTHINDNFVVGSDRLDFNHTNIPDNTKRMFFNKSKGAFRAGAAGAIYEGSLYNRYEAWDDANVGDYSFASGFDNMASGNSSTAMGFNTTASGNGSTAMGISSSASGISSIAIGTNLFETTNSTSALGESSIAFGENVTASGENSMAVGYGTLASQSYSTAIGRETTASGENSTAMGLKTTASGSNSTAMGYYTKANGSRSTAMGHETIASGTISTAMGTATIASGNYSTAMGFATTASSFGSLAIGQFNVGGGSATLWIDTDPLFEVGFGEEWPLVKRNAITVLKNGKVGIGTAIPTTFLQLTNGYEATLSNTNSGYFMIGRETGPNILFDTNEILARNNGANANLHLQQDGGNVYVGGTLMHSSDRRLKKDIVPLSYGLETILQLNPVAYNWINRTQDRRSLGLIAQEVQPIIGEIVHEDNDEAKTLSVSYTELIPVLIKAIQEQHEIIETMRVEARNQQAMIKNQNLKIEDFSAELKQKDGRLDILDQRINQFELLLKANNQ